MDMTPYEQFKKLKNKYPTRMIRITEREIAMAPGAMAGTYMRDFVSSRFKSEFNLEVTRWVHNYGSLTTNNPQLGLVYLASDSVVDPAMEVWGLIGHNVREISK